MLMVLPLKDLLLVALSTLVCCYASYRVGDAVLGAGLVGGGASHYASHLRYHSINPIDVPNFLALLECAQLIESAEKNINNALSISIGNSYWNSRVVYPSDIDKETLSRMRDVVTEIARMLRKHYQLDDWIQLYLETLVFARMREGDSVGWHADNAFYPDCTPNYAAFRTYSAVIYLNGDESFTGGLFQFYARQNETIVPHAGRMLAFGAGCDYFHQATPVASGTRYTIALWYTDRLEKANKYFHESNTYASVVPQYARQ